MTDDRAQNVALSLVPRMVEGEVEGTEFSHPRTPFFSSLTDLNFLTVHFYYIYVKPQPVR
jgi:hypothetical protein